MKKYTIIFVFILSLILLFILSRINYLLFHTIVELLSISLGIALLFFAFTKINLQEYSKFEILSITFAFVAIIDLLHTLTYKGINVFTSITANEPTQFWISARFLESISILFYTLSLEDKIKIKNTKKVFYAVFIILLIYLTFTILSILIWNFFPDCYIEGKGLTRFKIFAEYFIILVFLISLFLTSQNDNKNVYYFKLAILISIFSEFSFTLYDNVYGTFNMIGHLLKYISFVTIYRYVMINIIEEPYINIKILANELKKENEELEIAKKKAERADRAKTAFLSNVNHEIKTPLNIISGYIDILYLDEKEKNKKNLLLKVKEANSYLTQIFEDIITISKLEIDEFEFSWVTKNLKSFLESVIMIFKSEAETKNVELNSYIDESLNRDIFFPENAIYLIFSNLLNNAVKFTEKGKIDVNIKFENNLLNINIKDTGIGFDIKQKESLLNPFVQGEFYLNKSHKGTGLGLAIVNKLVNKLNGSLELYSEIDRGTEVDIKISFKNNSAS